MEVLTSAILVSGSENMSNSMSMSMSTTMIWVVQNNPIANEITMHPESISIRETDSNGPTTFCDFYRRLSKVIDEIK